MSIFSRHDFFVFDVAFWSKRDKFINNLWSASNVLSSTNSVIPDYSEEDIIRYLLFLFFRRVLNFLESS